MSNELKNVPLDQIRPPRVALRQVKKEGKGAQGFTELVDSIRKNGVLNPVVLREVKDHESGDSYYGLIDGLQRFTAAKDAGLTEIPAHIIPMEEGKLLFAQIIANALKIDTHPAQYAEQLKRILIHDPTLTIFDLAAKLDKSPQWIYNIMNLNKIEDKRIKALIDEQKIPLTNAYALSKLPPEDQVAYADRAMTLKSEEFVPMVNQRAKEIKDLHRQGKDTKPSEFVAVAHLRKLPELKNELENKKNLPGLLRRFNITTPQDALEFTLRWVLHLDPDSVEEGKQKEAERKRKDKEKAAAMKKERDALKEAEKEQALEEVGL